MTTKIVGFGTISAEPGTVIPMGEGVPWSETADGMYEYLKMADTDLDGFVYLLRLAAMIYQVRKPKPSAADFAEHAAAVYNTLIKPAVVDATG